MTIRYEDFIYKRCIGVDLKYVSIQEDLEWHTVNRIFTRWAEKRIKNTNLFVGVRAIGIDEIALKKGHKDFVCVLVNFRFTVRPDIDKSRRSLV